MRSMDSGIWWSAYFEPFYGPDYCQWTNMDLQRLHDGEYRGSSFRFKEGWVVPTVELLRRLTRLGLPIRTKNDILVHLCKPVDSMAAGEFYFQVGHQLPGRLSLKFTRRHPDVPFKMYPTVLEQEEERRLAANPLRYLNALRDTAYRNTPTDRILLTIILLNIQTGSPKREPAANFFLTINDPDNQQLAEDRFSSLPCPRAAASRETRSGSEGNIQRPRIRAPSAAVEPEECDENLIPRPIHAPVTGGFTKEGAFSGVENIEERSRNWTVGCHREDEGSGAEERTSLNDDYTGVRESLEQPLRGGAYEMPRSPQMRRGFESYNAVSARSAYNDEYTRVTEAVGELNVREMGRKMSDEMPMARLPVEEYTTTEQGLSARAPLTWRPHPEQLRDASYLPVMVEELNEPNDRKRSR